MNGANADPPPKTTRIPNNSKMIMTGASHHFFLAFTKFQRSFRNSILQFLKHEWALIGERIYANAVNVPVLSCASAGL